ncbi:hypothetical protein BHE74_00013613 [Ensete ventricosum]|nr:hypothetical protein BHE74_00013613 [Ensete ventricosum]
MPASEETLTTQPPLPDALRRGVRELAQMQSRFEVGAHQKLVVLRGYRHDWPKKACPGVVNLRKDQTSFGLCSSISQAIAKPTEWPAMEPTRISSFPSKMELTSFISFSPSPFRQAPLHSGCRCGSLLQMQVLHYGAPETYLVVYLSGDK